MCEGVLWGLFVEMEFRNAGDLKFGIFQCPNMPMAEPNEKQTKRPPKTPNGKSRQIGRDRCVHLFLSRKYRWPEARQKVRR